MGFLKDLFGGNKNGNEQAYDRHKNANPEDSLGVRDHFIRSKSFFEKQIKSCYAEISNDKTLYKELTESKGENFDYSMLFYSFNREYSNLINARYSKGDKVVDIVPDANPLMETTSKFWLPESDIDYTDGGDMDFSRLYNSLAIGVLAKVDVQYFQELSEVMKARNFHDCIADYLIHSQIPSHGVADKTLVTDDKALEVLVDIIYTKDKTEAEEKVKLYLEKYYYTRQNLFNYYNKHEFENGRLYYGYWAWVVSAIGQIKNLNDTTFSSNKFYPYDFVHWE